MQYPVYAYIYREDVSRGATLACYRMCTADLQLCEAIRGNRLRPAVAACVPHDNFINSSPGLPRPLASSVTSLSSIKDTRRRRVGKGCHRERREVLFNATRRGDSSRESTRRRASGSRAFPTPGTLKRECAEHT